MHFSKRWMIPAVSVFVFLLAAGVGLLAMDTPNTDSAHLIVTVEPSNGASPQLKQGDVMVYENNNRVPVTQMISTQGKPVELYVAIDEEVAGNFARYQQEVRNFISSLPPNVAAGVVSLRQGGIEIRQKPTTDHSAAAKAVSLPLGYSTSSPFESIVALLKQWPQANGRREIVLISSGIEPFGTNQYSNPFVDQAVAAVQRAEVPVFAIYLHADGHSGRTFWRTTWGETYLSRVADESGGEAYNIPAITVVSLKPFLNKITQRLQHQYRVVFAPKAQQKAGFVPVRATTEVPHLSLLAQDRVWIAANQ